MKVSCVIEIIDGFINGDLCCFEKGFIDSNGVLEVFALGFDGGPTEVRVGFDDTAIGDRVELSVGALV